MTKVNLTAEEIAKQQLFQAIRLWQEGEYVSSITLAGAAEEILGNRLRKAGEKSSFDSFKNLVLLINRNEGNAHKKAENRISDLINYAKNKLKHHAEDDPIDLDLKAEATELLNRAISNFIKLKGTGLVNDEMYDFLDKSSSP